MLKFQVSSGAPMFGGICSCARIGTLKHPLLRIKEKTTHCTVKTLKLIFSKWPPPHMQTSKTHHIHIFWNRNAFKYQNN